jgi:hypothetical protein
MEVRSQRRKAEIKQIDIKLQFKITFIVRLGDRIEMKTRCLIDKSTDQKKEVIMGRVYTPQGIQ